MRAFPPRSDAHEPAPPPDCSRSSAAPPRARHDRSDGLLPWPSAPDGRSRTPQPASRKPPREGWTRPGCDRRTVMPRSSSAPGTPSAAPNGRSRSPAPPAGATGARSISSSRCQQARSRTRSSSSSVKRRRAAGGAPQTRSFSSRGMRRATGGPRPTPPRRRARARRRFRVGGGDWRGLAAPELWQPHTVGVLCPLTGRRAAR